MQRILWLFMVTVGIGTTSLGAADFYLTMEECTTTLGYIGPSVETLKSVPGDKSIFACTRASKRITCDLKMEGNAPSVKGATVNFTVGLDSPPFLYFQDDTGSDFFAINLTNHRVVSISRFVSEAIIGSKVCRGSFMTESERNSLQRGR